MGGANINYFSIVLGMSEEGGKITSHVPINTTKN